MSTRYRYVPIKINYRVSSGDVGIITRPNASSGFWLCYLLPIAFLVTNIRHPFNTKSVEYRMISIMAWGFCLQSTNFFLYITFKGGRGLRMFYTFLPGAFTFYLYRQMLLQSYTVCAFWGIIPTVLYQYFYVKTLNALPKCFTFGEAAVVVQGVTLFVLSAVLKIPFLIAEPPEKDFDQMNAIMMEALLCLFIVFSLMHIIKILQKEHLFYPLMFLTVIVFCVMPVTPDFPIIILCNFILRDAKKIFLIIFYIGFMGLAVSTVLYQIRKTKKATTTVRKIFHIIVIFVFLPGLLYQCTLLYISTGVALALFTLLEVLRVAKIKPFEAILQESICSFTDHKDSGLIAFTPLYLLIGCALPMWIHPCPCGVTDSAITGNNLIVLLSGIISIGIGDTCASIVGTLIGKHKWWGTNKTIEGTLGSIFFQTIFVMFLYNYKFTKFSSQLQIYVCGAAIVITSLIEAFTDQVDNIVLPFVFYIIMNLA